MNRDPHPKPHPHLSSSLAAGGKGACHLPPLPFMSCSVSLSYLLFCRHLHSPASLGPSWPRLGEAAASVPRLSPYPCLRRDRNRWDSGGRWRKEEVPLPHPLSSLLCYSPSLKGILSSSGVCDHPQASPLMCDDLVLLSSLLSVCVYCAYPLFGSFWEQTDMVWPHAVFAFLEQGHFWTWQSLPRLTLLVVLCSDCVWLFSLCVYSVFWPLLCLSLVFFYSQTLPSLSVLCLSYTLYTWVYRLGRRQHAILYGIEPGSGWTSKHSDSFCLKPLHLFCDSWFGHAYVHGDFCMGWKEGKSKHVSSSAHAHNIILFLLHLLSSTFGTLAAFSRRLDRHGARSAHALCILFYARADNTCTLCDNKHIP